MVYYDELTDEEITLMLSIEKKKKIKTVSIITASFLLLTAFLIFSIVAYNYNPELGYAEDIVIRNDF